MVVGRKTWFDERVLQAVNRRQWGCEKIVREKVEQVTVYVLNMLKKQEWFINSTKIYVDMLKNKNCL